MNIRFWDYVTSTPVKLKLTPGQKLTYKKYYNDDEGWTLKVTSWEYIENQLICVHFTDGTDCDGRLSTFNAYICELNELYSGSINEEFGIKYPKWKSLKSEQRDYSAENMGY